MATLLASRRLIDSLQSAAGELPADWAGLGKLQTASLYYNKGLKGSIPKAWGSSGEYPGDVLDSLKYLVLRAGTVRHPGFQRSGSEQAPMHVP